MIGWDSETVKANTWDPHRSWSDQTKLSLLHPCIYLFVQFAPVFNAAAYGLTVPSTGWKINCISFNKLIMERHFSHLIWCVFKKKILTFNICGTKEMDTCMQFWSLNHFLLLKCIVCSNCCFFKCQLDYEVADCKMLENVAASEICSANVHLFCIKNWFNF